MSRRYVRQFRYDKFRGMDIFFSEGKAFVRLVAGGWRALRSRDYAGHAGFLTTQWRQFFASEMTGRGIRENPLDQYRTRRHWFVDMYRWKGFDDPVVREMGEKRLAWLRRKEKELEYDWWGAITSVKWLRRLFSRKKQDPEKDFCSENVINVLAFCGCPGPYPKYQNPEAVREWCRGRADFGHITGYSTPIA